MSETVTVPRWALEYVLKHDPAPTADWAFACAALKRALDTKTEIPDKPKPDEPEFLTSADGPQ